MSYPSMDFSDITNTILEFYPDTQAIYLFGSYGSEYERLDSDIDVALLLPPLQAKQAGSLALSECSLALAGATGRPVDLINLRMVDTVFQHQIVNSGRVVFQKDAQAREYFEMLVLSLYQKLNEERAGILAQIVSTKRILQV